MLSGAHRFPKQDHVTYGRPAAEVVGELAKAWGASRILLATNRSLADGLAAAFATALGDLCVGVFSDLGAHSPRDGVIAGAAEARRLDADLIVALGGGSVIDATKVIQLCLWAGLERVEQLDAYRAGRGPDRVNVAKVPAGVRFIAVPTTLSAAEFTPFAGVSDAARQVKESYTHPMLAPRAVVLDPAMTLGTPPDLWASTGMKAVDHAVEQLCHPVRAPYADALAADGLRRLARGLSASKDRPDDLDARLECQFGMWLAISGVGSGRGMGVSHAIGHTLGGSYGVPHGITSCVTLPAVLAWSAPNAIAPQAQISELLGYPGPAASAVRELVAGLGLPTDLRSVGILPKEFQAIAEHTMHDAGVRSNPRPITGPQDIVEILELAAG
ncbi:MAG: iron-containing alcohol dehydrogenase [Alphaproteobacteria bacterium]|nr:iron-containing alcohol dehydrogenase [Alphaproteobacteria bacterium]MBU1512836.1 iron-containing alcohol dehydrogenase [Alphaproteobacteria bacterium]MBU2095728.1 iron-containing alcohol dehydrogenase [Alphaproteobacteria bacterium]MBU2153184.1 iron-containing alcohol dehydrogenase [Alphaproteobacteria bacterium]MBU2309004.1 iron-containing alcohol dehydrogenase [Alphaproteobacteria bacterium]